MRREATMRTSMVLIVGIPLVNSNEISSEIRHYALREHPKCLVPIICGGGSDRYFRNSQPFEIPHNTTNVIGISGEDHPVHELVRDEFRHLKGIFPPIRVHEIVLLIVLLHFVDAPPERIAKLQARLFYQLRKDHGKPGHAGFYPVSCDVPVLVDRRERAPSQISCFEIHSCLLRPRPHLINGPSSEARSELHDCAVAYLSGEFEHVGTRSHRVYRDAAVCVPYPELACAVLEFLSLGQVLYVVNRFGELVHQRSHGQCKLRLRAPKGVLWKAARPWCQV